MLVEVAADAQRALGVIEHDQALVPDEAVAAAAGLLGEIVGQEFELAKDDTPSPRHGRRPPRQIISAHDPEMRHGRKTNAWRFTGYKLHVAVDAQAPVVTALTISAGNEHDGHHAAGLVEQQQPASRRPERVIGDTAYGNLEVREQLERRQIKVLAPLHLTGAANENKLYRDEFTIDLSKGQVGCPEGQIANIHKPRAYGPRTDGVRIARFTPRQCEPCPLRERCAPGGTRTIRINRREDLRQAAQREL